MAAAIQSKYKAQHAAVFPTSPWTVSPLGWTSQCQSSSPQAPGPPTVRVYNDGFGFCLDTPPFNYLFNHFPSPRPLINCKGLLHQAASHTMGLSLESACVWEDPCYPVTLTPCHWTSERDQFLSHPHIWVGKCCRKTGSILNAMDICVPAPTRSEGSLAGASSSMKAPFPSDTKLRCS